jgi:hypothetical protein
MYEWCTAGGACGAGVCGVDGAGNEPGSDGELQPLTAEFSG